MNSARAVAAAMLSFGLWISMADAACIGPPVSAFGAVGDGKTDDTAAIQSAINAAAAGGGGSVVFGVARYYTSGTFMLPAGVILCGAVEGPFDVAGASPAATAIAPTLLVTNTSAPFITIGGLGAGVADLLFHYPNQVGITAAAPDVYPYTILAKSPGGKVVRTTVTNAYNFLDIESGKVVAQDLFIGAFNIGVNVDHAYDHVTLRNLFNATYWDVIGTPSTPPTPIDNWVSAHGVAMIVNRADGIEVHGLSAFLRYAGIIFTDSGDAAQNPLCGFGTGSDFAFRAVQNGVVAKASASAGYQISNLSVSTTSGVAAAQVTAGGSLPPDLLIDGGSVLGTWSLGAFPAPPVGHLTAVNVVGYNAP